MKQWVKLLLFFAVEWLAKRNMQRYEINLMSGGWDDTGVITVVSPFKGVYITVDSPKENDGAKSDD